MPVRVKRNHFDFLAKNYTATSPEIDILKAGFDRSKIRAQPDYEENFIQRWYLSLQGDDTPTTSSARIDQSGSSDRIYRYDWAFGITVIQGYWWDWQKDLCEDGALAVHLLIEPACNALEAVPLGGTLSALRPSRNTRSAWELVGPEIAKTAASTVKIGAHAVPGLEYLSAPLVATSNVLDSYTGSKKNWFLYQFLDEGKRCATVEWRIDRRVMREYGPLLRGTLLLAFYGSAKFHPGSIRIHLRPQARYHCKGDIDFIVPTDHLPEDERVFLDVTPVDTDQRDEGEPS